MSLYMFERPIMSINYPHAQQCRNLTCPYNKFGEVFSWRLSGVRLWLLHPLVLHLINIKFRNLSSLNISSFGR